MNLTYRIQILCGLEDFPAATKFVNIHARDVETIDELIERHIRPQLAVLRDSATAAVDAEVKRQIEGVV